MTVKFDFEKLGERNKHNTSKELSDFYCSLQKLTDDSEVKQLNLRYTAYLTTMSVTDCVVFLTEIFGNFQQSICRQLLINNLIGNLQKFGHNHYYLSI